MIITRTPYRLSYFGGGTDYVDWFERYGGAVLGCAINKYCYITYRKLPKFFEHSNRLVYSNLELTDTINEIKHPSLRECLRYMKVGNGVEIHYDGDLPARSGVGSSSTFAVGLLNAIYAANDTEATPQRLASEAYHIEKEILHETVGYQDQVFAAYGGFRHIKFAGLGFEVQTHAIPQDRIDELLKRTTLVFTGNVRNSSGIASGYIKKMDEYKSETHRAYEMVGQAIDILCSKEDLKSIGVLLHESWELKKRRGIGVSNDRLDLIYSTARYNGVLGGKIIGAGGAGFMMLFSDPQDKPKIASAIEGFGCLPISIEYEPTGSKVIYNG